MSQEQIRRTFEDVSRRQLEIAYGATEGRSQVTDIWIYMSFPEGPGFGYALPLFGDGKQVVEAYNLDDIVKPKVGSRKAGWALAVVNPIADIYGELVAAYADSGEARPTRIVVHYDVKAEAMDADFTYSTLLPQSGAPGVAFDAWLENARATGDFSADALTGPEQE